MRALSRALRRRETPGQIDAMLRENPHIRSVWTRESQIYVFKSQNNQNVRHQRQLRPSKVLNVADSGSETEVARLQSQLEAHKEVCGGRAAGREA